MLRGTREEVAQLAAYALRAECANCRDKSQLVLRWFQGKYEVWCPVCLNRADFRERKSLTQMWREDPGSVPITVANRLRDKHGGERMTETALAKADERAIAARLDACRWATTMTLPQKAMVAQLAITYQLDPFMGELVWYEGAPLITFVGNLRIATRSGTWEDIELRPMTADEREEWGIKQPVAWICKVWKRGMRSPAIGIGTADPERPHRSKWDEKTKRYEGGNFIEREKPWAMARVRAGNAGLKMYFPHGLPIKSAGDEGIDVDTDTGQMYHNSPQPDALPFIIDAEARAIPDEAVAEADPWVTDIPYHGPPASEPIPAEASKPQSAEAPQEPKKLTPKEEAIERVNNLVGTLGRTLDDPFRAYFRQIEGVAWAEATVKQLDHFAHHLANLVLARDEKRAAEAATGKS